jgi:hypothetical protein
MSIERFSEIVRERDRNRDKSIDPIPLGYSTNGYPNKLPKGWGFHQKM